MLRRLVWFSAVAAALLLSTGADCERVPLPPEFRDWPHMTFAAATVRGELGISENLVRHRTSPFSGPFASSCTYGPSFLPSWKPIQSKAQRYPSSP